ncbi:hypothetical protein [Sciscionella marina]|uniref:hypothetical protein n=1 Tax=Sciscionella marina TaxID=508770 RepID=UPI0003700936|nr:hypothetical protein [Sciscionella marina]
MGYKFSLVLSRKITDDESVTLKEAIRGSALFDDDTLPTNADVPVTKIELDDTVSPSLSEAIESALEAVKTVPELGVPGLSVPAQPAGATAEDAAEVSADVVEAEAEVVDEAARA